MKLINKLLGYLNRVFDKDPTPFVALRLAHDDGFAWVVEEEVLTVTSPAGPRVVALNSITLNGVVAALDGVDGFTATVGDQGGRSARVLLDGFGSGIAGVPTVLQGYTSLLWSYLAAMASELGEMRRQVANMLLQLSTTTGEGVWLDVIGDYYGVRRFPGEADLAYGPRIIAETLRPRSNNVALEAAIEIYTGQVADVVDVTLYGAAFPRRNAAITRNSAYNHDSGAEPLYGLFDISYAYDLLNGPSLDDFQSQLRDVIGRLRAAGTHLRALALRGSEIGDDASVGTDVMVAAAATEIADTISLPEDATGLLAGRVDVTDAVGAPADESVMANVVHMQRNGEFRRPGNLIHSENQVVSQTLEGADRIVTPV